MTRRKRLFIVALILLALLLLLIWLLWVLFSGGGGTQGGEEVAQVEEVEEVEEVISTRPTISEQELQAERETRTTSADVLSLSKSFVIRYGSYSNEANFANLEDVLPLVSASFAARLQNTIDTSVAPEDYYGVSTSIVTVKVDEKSETASQVTVTTQREEAIGSPQNTTVKYQDIVLTFVMEDESWKVDSATWQ